MATDDSSMYTGVDVEPGGMFGNEKLPEDTKQLLEKQDQLLKQLKPELETLIATIDAEKKVIIDFVTDYVDNIKDDDNLLRAELKAAALYRKYLDDLKTKFTLALQELRGTK